MDKKKNSRRDFLKTSSLAIAGVAAPHIVPVSVFGKTAPSNQINVGMIGTGRQAVLVNLKEGFLTLGNCRVLAVNDADAWRMNYAAEEIKKSYSANKKGPVEVRQYDDYRKLIGDKDIDAVMISTTDHWHAPAAIAAALAGKHVSMEKAFTVAPAWGRAVVEAVKKTGVINRIDSEFRSLRPFNRAVELVHNGAIGELTHVDVGVPGELNGSAPGPQPTMPVPEELNYDMWLGPAFPSPYTLKRVHDPKKINGRPGWMRISDYCNGMITNWGAHLLDIALWGMRKDGVAPVAVKGRGVFDTGLWNTLSAFDLQYTFTDGMTMNYAIDVPFVKFNGKDGWIRIEYPDKLTAGSPDILNYKPKVSYADTKTDKADFLSSIETGKPTIEPLSVGYNVYLTSVMGLYAAQLGSALYWDAQKQEFINDNAANALLTRPFRTKWIDNNVIEWMNARQDMYRRG